MGYFLFIIPIISLINIILLTIIFATSCVPHRYHVNIRHFEFSVR